MKLEFTISEKDFVAAQSAHSRLGVVLPVIGGMLVVLGIIRLASEPKNLTSSVPGILLGLAMVSIHRVLWSYHYRKDKRLHNPIVVVISDEAVEFSTPTGSSRLDWKTFTRYVETKDLFLLYHGPNVFNIFPKRCFASEQLDDFRNLIQQKLGHGDRPRRKGLSPRAWIFVVLVAVSLVLLLMTIRNVLRQSAPDSRPGQTQSTP